jgi:DNA methylase
LPPARFSPAFVRAAIEIFTKPGDLILDPHVGGGTSLVEALASGRQAVGVDINPLAEFVTRVKCNVFSEAELDKLDAWAARVPGVIDIHGRSTEFTEYAELGYYKHLNHPSRWRLRKGIEQALASAIRLVGLDWKRSAAARCCVPRNGRSMAPASSHPSTNSAQRSVR